MSYLVCLMDRFLILFPKINSSAIFSSLKRVILMLSQIKENIYTPRLSRNNYCNWELFLLDNWCDFGIFN